MRIRALSRIFVTVVFCWAAATGWADDNIYRWVDEDGVTHFSDRPVDADAEQIELPKTNTPTPLRNPDNNTVPNASDPGAADLFKYEQLEILSPSSNRVLWNGTSQLSVFLSLSPELRSGDRLRVYLDGSRQSVNTLDFGLDNVFRGSHTLLAEVVSESGALLIRSQPVRFIAQ